MLKHIMARILIVTVFLTAPSFFWALEGYVYAQGSTVASTGSQTIDAGGGFKLKLQQGKEAGTGAQKVDKKSVKEKKKMSWWEKIAWMAAEMIIPTLAVVVVLTVFAPGVIGAIVISMVIGAVVSGLLTYLKEKRMNQFRDKKKSDALIMRDVLVSSTVSAITAPLGAVGGALIGKVGGEVAKGVLLKTFAKLTVVNFVNKEVASLAGGAVKNIYNDKVLHLDKKIRNLEMERDQLKRKLDSGTITEEELQRLIELEKELESLKNKEYYSLQTFKEDTFNNLLGSIFSAGVGTTVRAGVDSKLLSSKGGKITTALAKTSTKLFGNAHKATDIAMLGVAPAVGVVEGTTKTVLWNALKDREAQYWYDKAKNAKTEAEKKYYLEMAKIVESRKKNLKNEITHAVADRFADQTYNIMMDAAVYHVVDRRKKISSKVDSYIKSDAEDRVKEKLKKKYNFDDEQLQKYIEENPKAYSLMVEREVKAIKASSKFDPDLHAKIKEYERKAKLEVEFAEKKTMVDYVTKDEAVKIYAEYMKKNGEVPAGINPMELYKMAEEKYTTDLKNSAESALNKVKQIEEDYPNKGKYRKEYKEVRSERQKVAQEIMNLTNKRKLTPEDKKRLDQLRTRYADLLEKENDLYIKSLSVVADTRPSVYIQKVYDAKVKKWRLEHPNQPLPEELSVRFYNEAQQQALSLYGSRVEMYKAELIGGLVASNTKLGDLRKFKKGVGEVTKKVAAGEAAVDDPRLVTEAYANFIKQYLQDSVSKKVMKKSVKKEVYEPNVKTNIRETFKESLENLENVTNSDDQQPDQNEAANQ